MPCTMRPFWKKRRRYTLEELAFRRETRAEAVRSTLPLFSVVLMICMMAVLSLLCLKPLRELQQMESEKDKLQANLNQAAERLNRAKNEYMWMLQDAEYLEIIARDKNNLKLPNEKIVRIRGYDQPLR